MDLLEPAQPESSATAVRICSTPARFQPSQRHRKRYSVPRLRSIAARNLDSRPPSGEAPTARIGPTRACREAWSCPVDHHQLGTGRDDHAAPVIGTSSPCFSDYLRNMRKRWIAQAALNAKFKQSAGATYRLQVARIDVDHAEARGPCADKSGRERALCTDEAKAHDVSARTNARIESKTAEAGK